MFVSKMYPKMSHQFLLPHVCIVIVVLLITLNLCFAQRDANRIPPRSSYGEHCNKTHRCKSQSWLVCDSFSGESDESVCQCAKPDEMIFDQQKGKCVSLAGENCVYTFQQDEGETGQSRRSWSEKVDCLTGGECDSSNNICKCSSGYYAGSVDSLCHEVKTHGSSCSNSYECKDNLQCVNATCSCDPNSEVYNEDSFYFYYSNHGRNIHVPGFTCIRKVGQECTPRPDYDQGYYCVRNSVCTSEKKCKCVDKYSRTSTSLCGIGYGSSCKDTTSPCSDNLRCSNEKCQCPNPDFEVYDSELQLCRGIIGANCNEIGNSSCIDGAHCVYDEDEDDYHCQCDRGYVQVDSKTCKKEFGELCSYDSGIGCDSIAQLVCKERKCQCKNDVDIYEPERRNCSIPVGLPCEINAKCVRNAYCQKILGPDLPGRCKCQHGFEKARNRTCVYVATATSSMSPLAGVHTTFDPSLEVKIVVAPTSTEDFKDEPT